jgi:RNA polymerase sigma factor (sigma-70 family)
MLDFIDAIIKDIQQDKEESREELHILLRKYVDSRYPCFAHLAHRESMEDLADHIFVRILDSICEFQWQSDFSYWINEIIVDEIAWLLTQTLYKMIRDDVYSYLIGRYKNSRFESWQCNAQIEAEDNTEDAFVAFQKRIKSCIEKHEIPQDIREFDKFLRLDCRRILFRIARNKFIDKVRKRILYRKLYILDEPDVASMDPSPEKIFIEVERENLAKYNLMKLPDRERRVLELRYYKGLSVKKVAEIMNATEGAITNLSKRARDRMKELSKKIP